MPRYQYDSEAASAAAKKQKRGPAMATKVRNMLNSVDLDDKSRAEIVRNLVTGVFGEKYQALAATEILKQIHNQELVVFKKDVAVEQHKEMREIDNDLDTQLLNRLAARMGKELDMSEVKKIFREVRDEQKK